MSYLLALEALFDFWEIFCIFSCRDALKMHLVQENSVFKQYFLLFLSFENEPDQSGWHIFCSAVYAFDQFEIQGLAS